MSAQVALTVDTTDNASEPSEPGDLEIIAVAPSEEPPFLFKAGSSANDKDDKKVDKFCEKVEKVEKKEASTLPEYVDELERGLSSALIVYREQLEEVLVRHMEAMERMQSAHELETALLKTENSKLRNGLGMPSDQSMTAQSVLLQANDPQPNDKMTKGQTRKIQRNGDDDDDRKSSMNIRKRGKQGDKAAPQAPGGSWQGFVAWVPNGAALLNPEPWKALPGDVPLPPGTPMPGGAKNDKDKLRSQKSFKAGQQQTPQGIMMPFPSQPGTPMVGVVPSGEAEAKEAKVRSLKSDGSTKDDDDSSGSSHSSRCEQEKLELLEVWQASNREKKKLNSRLNAAEGESAFSGQQFGECDEAFANAGDRACLIINPDSNQRITWDLLSLFMVVYDMIMIPMMVFNLQDSTFLVFMEWTTRLFWTLDVGWSCCTGVVLADGAVEYNPRIIIKRYLKSWFGLDMFIVGSDWSGLIFSSGGMGLSRLARVSRVARVVRLLRLVRMQEVIANITERIQSDNIHLVVKLLKVLIVTASISHIIACGWFGIGNPSVGAITWVSVHEYTLDFVDVSEQYLISLHWALSQFTGGMDEVTPASTLERFFAVLVGIIVFIVAMVMLSTLTSSLTQQYIIGGSGARQMAVLKQYLKQNNVTKNLVKRVCRNAKHAVSGDLTADAVDLLSVISEPLKIEMHYEMYSRILSWHPFFHDYLNEGNQVMRRVCHQSISVLLLASGDVVFARGEEPPEPKMYFVVSGNLDYADAYGETANVSEKQWAAEAALWTIWRHRGTLTATNDVKIAMLDAQSFMDICKRQMRKQKGGFTPKRYAAEFVDELNRSENPTDLYDEVLS